jgi:hypothetical protein
LIRDKAANFPYSTAPWTPGEWYQASFDLKLFWSWGIFSGGVGAPSPNQYIHGEGNFPYDFTYQPAREFAFIWELNGSGKVKVYIDDVKLIKSGATPASPARELVLEDFEGPAYRWIGNFQKSHNACNGEWCGQFEVDFSETNLIGKKFPMPLDVYSDEYDRIEFSFKFEPDAGELNQYMILHMGDRSGSTRNYLFIHNQNHPPRQIYFRDGAQTTLAGFTLDERNQSGKPQERTREFLFVKNKFLWVRDHITPAKGDSYVAGPVWQVGKPAGSQGGNWFDTRMDTSLLLWFVPRAGSTLELISNPTPKGFETGWKNEYPAVISQYCQADKSAGETLCFDTILLPHRNDSDAKDMADSVSVLYDKDNATVLRIGKDLAVFNPDGKELSVGDVVTDYKILYISDNGSARVNVEGMGGTRTVYRGNPVRVE